MGGAGGALAMRAAIVLGGGALLVLGAAIALVPPPAGPAAAPETGRFDRDGLAFAYPAGWTIHEAGEPMAGRTTIAVLGTQPVPEACLDGARLDVLCYYREPLGPTATSLEVGTMTLRRSTLFDLRREGAVTSWVEVGGMPALKSDFGVGAGADAADLRVEWLVARPDGPGHLYRLAASVRGPDTPRVRAQLDGLLASVRIAGVDPTPAAVHDPAGIAAAVIADLDASMPGPAGATSIYDCFAAGLGRGEVTATLGPHGPLAAPMAATCHGSVQGVGGPFLRVDLAWRFVSGTARAGAEYRVVVHTDDRGRVASTRILDPFPRAAGERAPADPPPGLPIGTSAPVG